MKPIHQAVSGISPPAVTYVNYDAREAGWTISMHAHDYYQFMIVVSGSVRLLCDNRSSLITRGQLCIIPPGIQHQLEAQSSYAELGFGISSSDENHQMAALLASKIKKTSIHYYPEILNRVPDILTEMKRLTPISKLKVNREIESVLIGFLEQTDRSSSGFGEKLLEILNESLHERISLRNITGRMNIGQSQLEKRCNTEFGCGVIDLHNQLRINKACAFLLNSDESLERISEKLNFCDQAHFSRFFKIKMGVTPSQYRRVEGCRRTETP